MEFIESQLNKDDYELLYNQNNLLLHFNKSGSILAKEFSLVKGRFVIPKKNLKEGVSLEDLVRLMYVPELRVKWDTSLKVLKKLEDWNENYVVRSWMHSPMFMVSEREVIDKRMEFYHQGVFYCVSTSVPEDVKYLNFL